ncbi:MAG: hypothetical protein COX32_02245 [Candidatus Moranbacteria bacterium CG23_combo_of_CG06-09_8_20_14_all_41_28]|nr:MAG: hypothetical protein COX32_02245 [Candidatus Moranbacteria bacterium CG23_combo_of_CG06-09_8_20_14_all_41_28]
MSLTQELRAYAEILHTPEVSETEAAVELLKQAGLSEDVARAEVLQMEMEKEATEHLVMSGIDIDKAVAMVKAANINVKNLTSVSLVKEASEVTASPEAELLIKVAEYVEELESEIHDLKNMVKVAEANTPEKEFNLPQSMEKVAKSGMLTKEDLIELQGVSTTVLDKVASALEPAWEMGKAAGVARPKTDPILEFCVA